MLLTGTRIAVGSRAHGAGDCVKVANNLPKVINNQLFRLNEHRCGVHFSSSFNSQFHRLTDIALCTFIINELC